MSNNTTNIPSVNHNEHDADESPPKSSDSSSSDDLGSGVSFAGLVIGKMASNNLYANVAGTKTHTASR